MSAEVFGEDVLRSAEAPLQFHQVAGSLTDPAIVLATGDPVRTLRALLAVYETSADVVTRGDGGAGPRRASRPAGREDERRSREAGWMSVITGTIFEAAAHVPRQVVRTAIALKQRLHGQGQGGQGQGGAGDVDVPRLQALMTYDAAGEGPRVEAAAPRSSGFAAPAAEGDVAGRAAPRPAGSLDADDIFRVVDASAGVRGRRRLTDFVEACSEVRNLPPSAAQRLGDVLKILPEITRSFLESFVLEVELCVEYLLHEAPVTLTSTPGSWVRKPLSADPALGNLLKDGLRAYRDQYGLPPGELVGTYLKRMVDSLDGGVITRQMKSLICALFTVSRTGGSGRASTGQVEARIDAAHLPLVRTLLRLNPKREQLLGLYSRLARDVCARDNLPISAVTVVLQVHDMRGDAAGYSREGREGFMNADLMRRAREEFEEWGAIWGFLITRWDSIVST